VLHLKIGGQAWSPAPFLSPDGIDMVADTIRLMLFPAVMAFAASSDLLTMTISNRVSLILAAGFLILAPVSGMSAADMLSHAGAAAIVLVVAFGFFARGWIGGGDAKLAAATALWFGFDHLLDYLFYASLIGGAMTLLLIQFRLRPLPALLTGQTWAERLHRKDAGVPYGIALAAAALAVYPDTLWMKALAM
jgi:prepilin peptidase CpaA